MTLETSKKLTRGKRSTQGRNPRGGKGCCGQKTLRKKSEGATIRAGKKQRKPEYCGMENSSKETRPPTVPNGTSSKKWMDEKKGNAGAAQKVGRKTRK